MEKLLYENFIVYKNEDKNIFIHVDIDNDNFYKSLLSYFFNESKLLQYIFNKTNIVFSPKNEYFVKLYKKINDFIDEENINVDINDFKEELKNYIDWENHDNDDLLKLRRDKTGKVGEYIFHHLLTDYFKSLCIIPKLNLITNRNMSIYGIDVIFYNPNDNTLMFGESKVSRNLDNGISLVNNSLKNYEHQIFEEYRLILSNELLKISNLPNHLHQYVNNCMSFKSFIDKASINSITIPIFIMHGEDVDVKEIFTKMSKLKKTTILNLRVNYIIISLPIIDKNQFQSYLIEFLRERSDYYESMC